MSFRGTSKLLGCLGVSALLWLALPAVSWGQTFGTPSCAPCAVGSRHHCPPFYHVFVQGPPRLHWRHACPKPICDPCQLPHWGFYETCWNPWPFPPDWTHCHAAPPAAFVNLDPTVHPNAPQLRPKTVTPQSAPNFPGSSPAPRFPVNPGGAGSPPPTEIEILPDLPAPRRLDEKRPGPGF